MQDKCKFQRTPVDLAPPSQTSLLFQRRFGLVVKYSCSNVFIEVYEGLFTHNYYRYVSSRTCTVHVPEARNGSDLCRILQKQWHDQKETCELHRICDIPNHAQEASPRTWTLIYLRLGDLPETCRTMFLDCFCNICACDYANHYVGSVMRDDWKSANSSRHHSRQR